MAREGNLVNVLLSEKRDKAAAEAFFRSVRPVTESVPKHATTDGRDSYPGAIKAELEKRYLLAPTAT
ncbi:MAG TPA: DDE-type integrase/transposase/recombinase [Candidatus Binatia bacterium]|nr:DDE-type integrase/transposase/recombinase [Candidatus Binatia bacterium]